MQLEEGEAFMCRHRIDLTIVRFAVVMMLIGCVLSAPLQARPAQGQIPPATPQPGSSAPTTPQTTPVASPVAGTPQATTAGGKTLGTPQATAAVDDKRRSACLHYVTVLAGREKDSAALANPELQALARRFPDLTTCGAVAGDSEALCKAMGQGEGKAPCRMTWSTYRDLRANQKGGRFVFPDAVFEHCGTEIAPIICEKMHEAAESGDPKKCEWGTSQVPDITPDPKHHPMKLDAAALRTTFPTFCRALVTLDKPLCGRIADPDIKRVCGELIDRNAVYANGLKGLAESADEPGRTLAKAALGQADACEPYAKPARDWCAQYGGMPAPSGTAPPTTGSAAPTPG